MGAKIEDVKSFWEKTPLFSGESSFLEGTKEFFDEHYNVYVNDCFAGEIDSVIFPENSNKEIVLDLGCGVGFWTVELARRGVNKITASDLTEKALELTKKRTRLYGFEVELVQQNAEKMTFPDECFSHVNCLGVIHHTPNPRACIEDIARILRPNGTAVISVYYKNIFLNLWPFFRPFAKIIFHSGGGLKGRGRENIYSIDDVNEIVRLYDGNNNPLGKAFSKQEFKDLLTPSFTVESFFLHGFPARTLPFKIPNFLHKFLDKNAGFMIYAKCKK